MARWFRDLPLLWKLLLPSVVMLTLIGAATVFLLVRDQTNRTQGSVNRSLTERSLQVRAALQQEELSLLEATNLAANIRGMSEALIEGDRAAAESLLRSVAAIKPSVTTLAVFDRTGRLLVELGPSGQRRDEDPEGQKLAAADAVQASRFGNDGARHGGLLTHRGQRLLMIAAPVCAVIPDCEAAGVVLAATDVANVLTSLPVAEGDGITIRDLSGSIVATVGTSTTWEPLPDVATASANAVRTTTTETGTTTDTLQTLWLVQDEHSGSITVALATGRMFDEVRATGLRLAALLGIGLLVLVVAVAAITRSILGQVRDVVATNRALELGNLAARVERPSRDEIGTIARGLNQMAARLQVSHQELEDRVEQRTQQVRDLLHDRTEFFASLSHELRTPLAIILSQSDLLLLSPGDASGVTKSGTSINQTATDLLRVVNEILELARAEVGEVPVALESVDVVAALDDMRATLENLAQSGGQRLLLDVPPLLPDVDADPRRLREVMVNLVDNAVKYSPSGSTIRIQIRDRETLVTVDVIDQGPGIPASAVDGIFEPFRRAENSVPREGRQSTGLGLTLARRLAQAMGGDVTYVASETQGSCFRISLPVAAIVPGR